MSTMASQITSLTIVYSTVYARCRSKKLQTSASLAFVRGIHRSPVNSPHKRPLMQKKFPFDGTIINFGSATKGALKHCSDVTWTSWCLRPLATWAFIQHFGLTSQKLRRLELLCVWCIAMQFYCIFSIFINNLFIFSSYDYIVYPQWGCIMERILFLWFLWKVKC